MRSLSVIVDRSHVQVILVDDGSTDDGADRAVAVLEDIGFPHICIRQANSGAAAARNTGLMRATSRWIYFLDADDELLVDPLSLVCAVGEKVTMVLGGAVLMRDDRIVRRSRPQKMTTANAWRVLSSGNPIPIGSAIIHRDCITHPFDTTLPYLEDWQFWIQNQGLYEYVVMRPDVTLVRIHAHGGNRSGRYGDIGACRERIAREWLQVRSDVMDSLERNNWTLQREIGRMLQRQRPDHRAWTALPASPSLYLKFAAHACMGRRLLCFDPYAER